MKSPINITISLTNDCDGENIVVPLQSSNASTTTTVIATFKHERWIEKQLTNTCETSPTKRSIKDNNIMYNSKSNKKASISSLSSSSTSTKNEDISKHGIRSVKKLPLGRSYSSPPGNGRRPHVNKSCIPVPPLLSTNFETERSKMHKTKIFSMRTKDQLGAGDSNHMTYCPNRRKMSDRKMSDSWIGSMDTARDRTLSRSFLEKETKDSKKDLGKNVPSLTTSKSSVGNIYLRRPKLNLKKFELDKKFIPIKSNKATSGNNKIKDQNNNIENNTEPKNQQDQSAKYTTSTARNEDRGLQEADIREMIHEHFSEQLEGVEYKHDTNEKQSVLLSQKIHDRLKTMTNGSFKFIVSVFLGEIRDDGMETSSQCVWDPKQDCVVMSYYKNESLFAIAVVFAIALD